MLRCLLCDSRVELPRKMQNICDDIYIDLNYLTENERDTLLQVLARDEDLRKLEKKRIGCVNQAVLLIFEHHKAIIVIIREFNRAEICCRILQFIEFTCAFFVSLYSALKNELEEHKKKSASEDELNSRTRVCARCRGSLGFLFNSGAYCPKCSALVCKLCRRDNNATQWLCTLCAKIR